MKKAKREARYLSLVTVQANDLYSLLEGMRYDRCYPESEAESRKILALADHQSYSSMSNVIRLIRTAPDASPPTDARWRSFGCRVLDYRSVDEMAITDAEILNLLTLPESVRR